MQLLNTRIEAQPGRKPQMASPAAVPSSGSDEVGEGSTLITVTNGLAYENAYRIRVLCDNPLWQDEWVRLRALPAAANLTDIQQVTTQQRDQYGAQDRWVRVFVPRNQSRNIQLLFDLPRNPRSRAGLYALRVVIEEEAMGAPTANARARQHILSANLLVLPYFDWAVTTEPKEASLSWFRRTAPLAVVVRSKSNDWLYCGLSLPIGWSGEANGLRVENQSERIAVPPPAPDEEAFSERIVPLKTKTGLGAMRGDSRPLPLALTLQRLDAPTAPRFRDEDTGQPRTGAVMLREAGEQITLANDRGGRYYPPIPAQITDAAGGIASFIRGIAYTLLGLVITLHLAVLWWEQANNANLSVKVLSARVNVGDPIVIQGNHLAGSRVYVRTDPSKPFQPVDVLPGKPGSGLQKGYTNVNFKADPKYDGQKLQVQVQRVGFLPWLAPLLPRADADREIEVGKQPAQNPTGQVATNPTGNTSNNGTTSGTPPIVTPAVDNGNSNASATTTGGNTASTNPATGTANGSGSPSKTGVGTTSGGTTGSPNTGTGNANTAAAEQAAREKAEQARLARQQAAQRQAEQQRAAQRQAEEQRAAEVLRQTQSGRSGSSAIAVLPPTYTRLLLRDYSGADNAADTSALGNAIRAHVLMQNDPSQAVALAASLHQHTPKSAEEKRAVALSGAILMQRDEGKGGDSAAQSVLATFKRDSRLAPDCALVYTQAAISLHNLGRHSEAVTILRDGQKRAANDSPAAPFAFAWAWRDIGETASARSSLQTGLQSAPALGNDPKIRELQGVL